MYQMQTFNQIYKENYSNVFRLCLSYVSGNENLAEELSQEVFVKVWQHREEFRNEAKISTWIYRIAVNTCLMHLRKIKKLEEKQVDEIPDLSNETEEEVQNAKIGFLKACIKKLDEIGKMIITMVLEEIPQSEIAEVTGLSNENVRVKVHRCKRRLFKCISQKEKEANL